MPCCLSNRPGSRTTILPLASAYAIISCITLEPVPDPCSSLLTIMLCSSIALRLPISAKNKDLRLYFCSSSACNAETFSLILLSSNASQYSCSRGIGLGLISLKNAVPPSLVVLCSNFQPSLLASCLANLVYSFALPSLACSSLLAPKSKLSTWSMPTVLIHFFIIATTVANTLNSSPASVLPMLFPTEKSIPKLS